MIISTMMRPSSANDQAGGRRPEKVPSDRARPLKRPLTGVYLSFFWMVTLLILVGSTWMGLYLAKRITRPVQMLAAAAREIGAGRLDQRVELQIRVARAVLADEAGLGRRHLGAPQVAQHTDVVPLRDDLEPRILRTIGPIAPLLGGEC